MNTIITIARQYGSGGREVGHKIAEILGIKCYDRDLITLAAEKSGLSEEALHHADEKAASSLLYTLVMSSNMYHSSVDPANAGDMRDVGLIPREDPLEKGKATHSSILAWNSPWTEEPGELQSLWSQKSQT